MTLRLAALFLLLSSLLSTASIFYPGALNFVAVAAFVAGTAFGYLHLKGLE